MTNQHNSAAPAVTSQATTRRARLRAEVSRLCSIYRRPLTLGGIGTIAVLALTEFTPASGSAVFNYRLVEMHLVAVFAAALWGCIVSTQSRRNDISVVAMPDTLRLLLVTRAAAGAIVGISAWIALTIALLTMHAFVLRDVSFAPQSLWNMMRLLPGWLFVYCLATVFAFRFRHAGRWLVLSAAAAVFTVPLVFRAVTGSFQLADVASFAPLTVEFRIMSAMASQSLDANNLLAQTRGSDLLSVAWAAFAMCSVLLASFTLQNTGRNK